MTESVKLVLRISLVIGSSRRLQKIVSAARQIKLICETVAMFTFCNAARDRMNYGRVPCSVHACHLPYHVSGDRVAILALHNIALFCLAMKDSIVVYVK
jgi:hypothetical protein